MSRIDRERKLQKIMELYNDPKAMDQFVQSIWDPFPRAKFPRMISDRWIPLCPLGCFEPQAEMEFQGCLG
jgi:hypothetical protein